MCPLALILPEAVTGAANVIFSPWISVLWSDEPTLIESVPAWYDNPCFY